MIPENPNPQISPKKTPESRLLGRVKTKSVIAHSLLAVMNATLLAANFAITDSGGSAEKHADESVSKAVPEAPEATAVRRGFTCVEVPESFIPPNNPPSDDDPERRKINDILSPQFVNLLYKPDPDSDTSGDETKL